MTTIKKIHNLRSCYPKASLKEGGRQPQDTLAYAYRKWKYVWKMQYRWDIREGDKIML